VKRLQRCDRAPRVRSGPQRARAPAAIAPPAALPRNQDKGADRACLVLRWSTHDACGARGLPLSHHVGHPAV
jgi:hypothetical protein